MKQLDMKCKTQQTKNIKDVFTENEHQNFNSKTNRMKRSMASTSDRGKGAAIELNIFLTQNKGKGPPGRQRSPGTNKTLRFADSYGDSFSSVGAKSKTINSVIGNLSINKIDDYKIHNYNFLIHSSNFNVMKKQFLFLVVFVLAAFVNISKSYGQCTTDALHPQANVAYHYTTPATGGTYEWFVTTNPDIKAKVKEPVGTLFTWTGETTADVTVTWTAAAVTLAKTTPIYLALWYTETTTSTCTVENVRALQIAPVNTFLLAITGVDGAGATSTTVCAAPVLTAVVNDPANVSAGEDNLDAAMAITYGTNTLTYKITASGVNGNWMPHVRIPALTGVQTYVSVDWSTDNSTWTPFNPAATAATGGDYTPTTTDVSVSVAGTPYYVRLVIAQSSYESLADQALNVAVDGFLATDHTVSDIISASNCTEEAAFGKNATVTILHRPTITPGNPAFMTKTP